MTEESTINPDKQANWSTRITADNALRETSTTLQFTSTPLRHLKNDMILGNIETVETSCYKYVNCLQQIEQVRNFQNMLKHADVHVRS